MIRIAILFAAILFSTLSNAAAATLHVLALGDSLTAGLGLEPSDSYPVKLEAALKAKGYDVTIVNAGVSGDTAAAGLARLDWALDDSIKAAIIELGANDALRGLQPAQTEQALEGILARLKQRNIPVLIAGMRAPPNLGPDYSAQFDGIYPRLAEKYGALIYPFFLQGVAAEPSLNQGDGMHPNAKGVEAIVSAMLPMVEQLLGKATQN